MWRRVIAVLITLRPDLTRLLRIRLHSISAAWTLLYSVGSLVVLRVRMLVGLRTVSNTLMSTCTRFPSGRPKSDTTTDVAVLGCWYEKTFLILLHMVGASGGTVVLPCSHCSLCFVFAVYVVFGSCVGARVRPNGTDDGHF